MLALRKPSPALRPYVEAYWCVRDEAGEAVGMPITTTPRPGGVLTVNLGIPNRTSDGASTPVLSVSGIQTATRGWRAEAGTHFVMALLTPAGLARLAPGAGRGLVDQHVELGALLGDFVAAGLGAAVRRGDGDPHALEGWLRERLLDEGSQSRGAPIHAICAALARARSVGEAAEWLGLSRRHLSRLLGDHLGVGPKTLADLYRLDRSLRSVQTRSGSGAEGFADQAHQVRSWRERLGTTPGRYGREGPSELATAFTPAGTGSSFYL